MTFTVYACGSNGKYQLGTGDDRDLNHLEKVFESEIEVKKIVCGGNHTFILLKNGDLYSCGDNTHGQCAIAGGKTVRTFTQIPKINNSNWKNCSAGYEFSILINELNEIYSCGFGLKGELGLDSGITKADEATKINLVLRSDVKELKSCLDHTVLLTSDGQLYGWGNGRSGKLGDPRDAKIWIPRTIKLNMKISKVDVGRDFTVVSDGDKLLILGKDRYDMNRELPSQLEDFKAMWSSIHVLNHKGRIISIGNNSHGQLLRNNDVDITQWDVGSEHGIILRNNKVLTWGWGEHGNCGINNIASVTFDYLNELYTVGDEEEVVLIKGGCATTWLVTKSNYASIG